MDTLMEINRIFFQKLLYVEPLVGNNIKPTSSICYKATPQPTDYTTGIPNSDFHIYVRYGNYGCQPSDFLSCPSDVCVFAPGYRGVRFGNLNFDQDCSWDWNPTFYQFIHQQQNVLKGMLKMFGLHSSLHQYWWNSATNAFYTPSEMKTSAVVRSMTTSFLKTPKVLAAVQSHYSCLAMIGLPFQNSLLLPTNVAFDDYWERLAVQNDIMGITKVSSKRIFSIFDTAALQDTNWYTNVDISLANPTKWGAYQSCNFVMTSSCTYSEEYCDGSVNLACDYLGYVSSQCDSSFDIHSEGACNFYAIDETHECEDTGDSTPADINTQEYFGFGSRCLRSQVSTGSTVAKIGRCYQSSCNADATQIYVTFGSTVVTCTTQGSSMSVPGMVGVFYCPWDFSLFCTGYQSCNCSNQGFCNNGVCICIEGYGGSTCSIVITTCHTFCAAGKCNGSSQNDCTQCDTTLNFIYSPIATVCTCQERFFFQTATQTCVPCDVSCQTCTGPSSLECSSCDTDNGFYDSGSLICSPCDSKCLTCSGPATTCESCNPLNKRIGPIAGLCGCSPGFFDSGPALCSTCNPQCKTCFGLSTTCTSCDSLLNRVGPISGICNCGPGYYEGGSGLCLPCHYSCNTCSDGTNTGCLSCDATKFRTQGSVITTCVCQTGKSDPGTPLCITCDPTCLTCNGTTANDCVTCDSTKFRTGPTSSKCNCLTGKFSDPVTFQCIDCDQTCSTCSGSLSTNCLTCDESKFQKLNNVKNTCECVSGRLQDANGVCNVNDIANYDNIGCLVEGRGQYLNSQTGRCAKCSNGCSGCFGGGFNQCTGCVPPKQLYNKTCICPNSFFESGKEGLNCENLSTGMVCDKICNFCFGNRVDECYKCADGIMKSQSQSNECLCPLGTFKDNIMGKCIKCDSSCKECDGFSEQSCLQCYENKPVKDKRCNCFFNYYTGFQGICDEGITSEQILIIIIFILGLVVNAYLAICRENSAFMFFSFYQFCQLTSLFVYSRLFFPHLDRAMKRIIYLSNFSFLHGIPFLEGFGHQRDPIYSAQLAQIEFMDQNRWITSNMAFLSFFGALLLVIAKLTEIKTRSNPKWNSIRNMVCYNIPLKFIILAVTQCFVCIFMVISYSETIGQIEATLFYIFAILFVGTLIFLNFLLFKTQMDDQTSQINYSQFFMQYDYNCPENNNKIKQKLEFPVSILRKFTHVASFFLFVEDYQYQIESIWISCVTFSCFYIFVAEIQNFKIKLSLLYTEFCIAIFALMLFIFSDESNKNVFNDTALEENRKFISYFYISLLSIFPVYSLLSIGIDIYQRKLKKENQSNKNQIHPYPETVNNKEVEDDFGGGGGSSLGATVRTIFPEKSILLNQMDLSKNPNSINIDYSSVDGSPQKLISERLQPPIEFNALNVRYNQPLNGEPQHDLEDEQQIKNFEN